MIAALPLLAAGRAAPPPAGPACDAAKLEAGVEAFGRIGRTLAPGLAAAALLEACAFAPPVADALGGLRDLAGSPEATLADLRFGMAEPVALGAACRGDFGALAQLGSLPPADRRPFLRARCGIPFATDAEWNASVGFLVSPLAASALLRAKGVDEATIRAYARGLAGLGPSSP